jgi:hypothetical protein
MEDCLDAQGLLVAPGGGLVDCANTWKRRAVLAGLQDQEDIAYE